MCLSQIKSVVSISTTNDDLCLDRTIVGCIGEIYREECRHSGSRVVPGTTGEDGEGANHLVGVRIVEEGAIVGHDEEVTISGEVDKRVEVVLINV